MASRKKVQDAHISAQLRALHDAVLDIVHEINRPERDALMIERAGITLDRALFPLLVLVGRFGPIGVVELAGRVGRDYTTVSRQLGKLEGLGLAKRRSNPHDARLREAVITPKGKAMTDRVDAAREKMGRAIFASWRPEEIDSFVALTRRYADAMTADTEG